MRAFLAALEPARVRLDRVASRHAMSVTHIGPLTILASPEVDVRADAQRAIASAVLAPPTEVQRMHEVARASALGLLETGPSRFAVVGWDGHELFAARDCAGFEGMWWTTAAGGIVVASELGLLLESLVTQPDVDDDALARWLTSTPQPSAATLFHRVQRLPGGSAVRFAAGAARTVTYWEPTYGPPTSLDREAASELVRDGLARAIGSHAEGFGPVALELSGGIDSMALAAVGRERFSDMHAYSGVFPEQPIADEAELIWEGVAHLGLHAEIMEFREGSALRGALNFVDQFHVPPESVMRFVWEPLFERAAAAGRRVMLNGTGGDELFGASAYLFADLLRSGRLSAVKSLMHRSPVAARTSRRQLLGLIWRTGALGALPAPPRYIARRTSAAAGWLNPRFRGATRSDPHKWKRATGPRWWSYQLALLLDPDDGHGALDYLRRSAAASGLVQGLPLLDPRLVSDVLSIAPELAFDPHMSRALLREALRSHLPDSIRLRSEKARFNSIAQASLRDWDRGAIARLFSERHPHVIRLLDPGTAAQLRDGGDAMPIDILWRCIAAECWLRDLATPGWAVDARDRLELRATKISWRRG